MMSDRLKTLADIDNIKIARSVECDPSDLTKHIKINTNDLTIFSQNIRSIYCNFDSFIAAISTFSFEADIIILTECRLSDEKSIPQLINYTSHITTRRLNQNDGVVVYIRDSLRPRVKEINLVQASCLQLDILNNIIMCIYRSPSHTNSDSFTESLSTELNALGTQKSIIIAGDINININPKDTEQSYERKNRINYLTMLSTYGILPGHILPTRGINCLDHFMLKINSILCSTKADFLFTTRNQLLLVYYTLQLLTTTQHSYLYLK